MVFSSITIENYQEYRTAASSSNSRSPQVSAFSPLSANAMSISAKLLEKYLEHQQTNFGLARNFSPPALSKRLARPIQKPSLQNRSLRMDTKESSYMGRQNFPISTPVQGFATQWSEERVHQIQARLARKLGPEYITQRPGPGGSSKLW